MKFSETIYGDLSNKKINKKISVEINELTSLEGSPKEIGTLFNCQYNKNLKNIKHQIIKYQIKAKYYLTDEGEFTFSFIEKDFFEYAKKLELKKEQQKIKQQIIKNNNDYGLSI